MRSNLPMGKSKFAACHPGKIGDALYTLPLLRYIYGITGDKIDFYTSDYCAPMRSLFEYQPCINSFNIASDYKVERMDMGCQPWYMPIEEYEQVFQLGFQSVPDRAIHQFIAKEQGITTGLGIRYEHPEVPKWNIIGDYVCIAPRGETSYSTLFNEVADKTLAVIIGGEGDYTGHGIDMTGISLLQTCSLLSRAKGFVGLMSAMLVLANGFDIPRIAPHDNRSWDMRHVVYTPYNHYPINPTAEEVLQLL
jgi:hypothetical protein